MIHMAVAHSKHRNFKMGCPGKWKHGPQPAKNIQLARPQTSQLGFFLKPSFHWESNPRFQGSIPFWFDLLPFGLWGQQTGASKKQNMWPAEGARRLGGPHQREGRTVFGFHPKRCGCEFQELEHGRVGGHTVDGRNPAPL